jgi:hypothetical protein
MKLTIMAASSSGGGYPVDFSDESGAMRVFCHCQAGMLQQICKHKLALLKGDSRMLHDSSQEELLRSVLGSSSYPALKQAFDEYERAISNIEIEMNAIKQREKALKSGFAYELTHGRKKT